MIGSVQDLSDRTPWCTHWSEIKQYRRVGRVQISVQVAGVYECIAYKGSYTRTQPDLFGVE